MSRWTDEELRELVTLWPTNSASQIAKRLQRPRWTIRSKAKRLRQEGRLPRNLLKHFDVNPPMRRPPQNKIMPPKLRSRCGRVRCSSSTPHAATGRSAGSTMSRCSSAAELRRRVIAIAHTICGWCMAPGASPKSVLTSPPCHSPRTSATNY